jgi:hypothetical protein
MFLVDAGYACKSGFLPPYIGVRYHLSENGPRNRPTNARELYNLRHSSLRVTVERAIVALKGRFRILDNKPFHKYTTQVKLGPKLLRSTVGRLLPPLKCTAT